MDHESPVPDRPTPLRRTSGASGSHRKWLGLVPGLGLLLWALIRSI